MDVDAILEYSAEDHAVLGRIVGDSADTDSFPGYRLLRNEQHNFDLDLSGKGFNVNLENGQSFLVNQSSINENVVEYKTKPSSDGKRDRPSGWHKGKGKGWVWLKDVLLGCGFWPGWFTPKFSNPTKAKGDANAEEGSKAGSAAAAAAAATTAVPAAGQATNSISSDSSSSSNTSAPTPSVLLNVSRGLQNPKVRPKRQGKLAKSGGPDTSEWIWYYTVACSAPGCYARAMVGQLYALCPALVLEDKQKLEDAHHHTKLSVRFHGDCLHKVDGPSFGRLDGARREAVRELLQGRGTREVHDKLMDGLPPEHKLDGNVSKCGASKAVLRKIKNEKKVSGPVSLAVGPVESVLRLCNEMYAEDEKVVQAMQGSSGKKAKVSCIGYRHVLYMSSNQWVFGFWLDFNVSIWVKMCRAGNPGGKWVDATGNQVVSINGEPVLATYAFCQHPWAALNPFLRGDQVPGPLLMVLMLHTLRTATYILEGMGKFYRMVAASVADAKPMDARPAHPKYLPRFIMTDHDNALINGFSLLFNMCM